MEGPGTGTSSSENSSSCTWGESFCCEEGEFWLSPFGELPICGDESFVEECYTLSNSNDIGAQRVCKLDEGPCEEKLAIDEVCFEEELSPEPSIVEDLQMKMTIFAHSHPVQFPDIMQSRESAFGSIFVKHPVPVKRRSSPGAMASQFNMIPIDLDHIDKGSFSVDSDKRSVVFKSSVLRDFEKRGIGKDISASSTSQWDVTPIIKDGLFTIKINDGEHHTRQLSKIEERIMISPVQILKFAYAWPSGSTWTGHWDGLGMAGVGTYVMPHDVCYIGKMQDGMCHDDDATLLYPNGFKAIHCNFVNGVLTDYQFQFPDGLDHEKKNWQYCQYPDRRYWSEVQNGLKPAKTAQKTPDDPPRRIPPGCYDTIEGFYNPQTKILISPEGQLLRVPTCDEEDWIINKCRKGFPEIVGFRPDLHENWFNNDSELINHILDMQNQFFRGEITHDQLYQFYADQDILPSSSPYKKTKTESQMEMEYLKESCPHPKKLQYRLEKRYMGHRIQPKNTLSSNQRKPNKRGKHSSERKAEKDHSVEKLPSKIKFYDGKKTPPGPTVSLDSKDSKSILKKQAQGSEIVATPLEQKLLTPTISEMELQPGESNMSLHKNKDLVLSMRKIIMEVVNGIVVAERERHRDRLIRTMSFYNLPFGPRDDKEKYIDVLQELYASIPGKEEFCDSVPRYTCDLKKLAQDKFEMVKYWGKRIFKLEFDNENCKKTII